MEEINVVKIVCEINQNMSEKLAAVLTDIGILNYHVQAGRSIVYREKKVLFGISTSLILEEDPLKIFCFYIPSTFEMPVLQKLVKLFTSGYGSIWSENVSVLGNKAIVNDAINENALNEKSNIMIPSNLMCIDVIVQRGLSDDIVKSALDMGVCVPSIIYGIGTGFRNKLGLLRITIPADKEVVRVLVSKENAEDVMNSLIDAGKLDCPGKGFIYMYPVNRGIINTKIFRGKSLHAASMEQVIAAIDSIKGNVEWRKREILSVGEHSNKKRKFLADLANLSLYSDEGTSEHLVTVTMNQGASGATISKVLFTSGSSATSKISPSRERSDFIIGAKQKSDLVSSIMAEDLFNKNSNGLIELKSVSKACTYLP